MELNIRPVLNNKGNTLETQKIFSNPFQTQNPVESSIYHLFHQQHSEQTYKQNKDVSVHSNKCYHVRQYLTLDNTPTKHQIPFF